MGVNAGKFQPRVKSQKRFTIQYDSALPLKKKRNSHILTLLSPSATLYQAASPLKKENYCAINFQDAWAG